MRTPQPSSTPMRRLSMRRDSTAMRRTRSRNSTFENEKKDQLEHIGPATSDNILSDAQAKSLDLLSEEELFKLTRTNTKKNHGGRKGRFRSQMERVCRRLDNMAIEVRLQQRPHLEALPIVEPEDEIIQVEAFAVNGEPNNSPQSIDCNSEESGPCSNSVTESLELDSQGEDCFAIEPATNESVFSSKSSKSMASNGRPKFVRISTSVSFLEYSTSGNERKSLSVSTCTRFQHPTRKRRDAMLRRAMKVETSFPRARMNLRDRSPVRETTEKGCGGRDMENNRNDCNAQRTTPAMKANGSCNSGNASNVIAAKPTPLTKRPKSPPPARAAYALPSPHGPYGPRVLPK